MGITIFTEAAEKMSLWESEGRVRRGQIKREKLVAQIHSLLDPR